MLIKIGYELVFEIPAPTAMLLLLYTHPSRESNIVRAGKLRIEPSVRISDYMDCFGNRVGRILAPAGRLRLWNDAIIHDSGEPDDVNPRARQVPLEDLPDDVIQFLLASRYCEVDRMSQIAWDLFGTTAPGWARVQAICDWAHNHVQFGYAFASPTKTAFDVYNERRGVCRDFMHLAITMCRALNIPARYATGYLGDIGIPPQPFPMDFSAWFEVYLDGRWYTFNARHNTPRIGRVLMARGRDAVDVALTTSFGPSRLEKFEVWTDEVNESALSAAV